VRREGARRAPRAGDNEDGIAMLKLKDWPPDSDFSVELVRHNQVWFLVSRICCHSASVCLVGRPNSRTSWSATARRPTVCCFSTRDGCQYIHVSRRCVAQTPAGGAACAQRCGGAAALLPERLPQIGPLCNYLNPLVSHPKQDFLEMLPLKEYTHPRAGPLNLAAQLPQTALPPDLGPKSYIAFGRCAASYFSAVPLPPVFVWYLSGDASKIVAPRRSVSDLEPRASFAAASGVRAVLSSLRLFRPVTWLFISAAPTN